MLGGPGTGKTTALERRFLRLSGTDGLAPHRILFLCTNRSYSSVAKDRLALALLDRAMIEIPVFTWHALAYHLVTRYYPKLGYRDSPILLTAQEQWGITRELLAAERPAEWGIWGDRLPERGFIDEVADFCLRVQQKMMNEADLDALVSQKADWGEVVRFYGVYREHLKRESRLDYAGLISEAVRLTDEDEEVRSTLSKRFPHVLVDDGEECSPAQRELLLRLEVSNLVVAADPDCGIETFRGAEPDWVLGFEKLFGKHSEVVLEQSHRLGKDLLEPVRELIAHNLSASHRASASSDHESSYVSRLFPSASDEVESIARELRRIHLLEGVPWEQMAVLVSQPAYLLQPLERAFDRWEVPFSSASGDRSLSSEPSVAPFLDLVRVALADVGWEELLPNLVTSVLVGAGFPLRRKLERTAWQEGRSLTEVVEQAPELDEFRLLRDLIERHQDNAESCFYEVFSASSYYQGMVEKAQSDPSGQESDLLDAVVAFSHSLGRFVERRHGRGSILDYLHEAARADFGADPWLPAGRSSGGVALLSFHASKGREWDTVVVAGCLDAWIPKGRRASGLFDPFGLEIAEIADREVEAIADDRRTFYVAATRARRRVIFTVSPGPSGRGRPSRFLAELAGAPPEEVPSADMPPLTLVELQGQLRRTAAGHAAAGASAPDSAERIAAAIALSEIPGCDPSRWYGRWDWTQGTIPLVKEGEFRTSYSRLSVYDNCGLQYVLQSVLGLDPTSTHAMKFGTWLHALFQAVHDGVITNRNNLWSEYRTIFDPTVFPNATIARQYRRDGENMLEVFLKYELTDRTVKTEHFFEFPHEGATLRGRIDRVDKIGPHLRLTDYKTAKWASGKEEAKESLQLAIYHLAAKMDAELKELGEPNSARLVFPGATYSDGKPIERVQMAADAEKVIERLPELIQDVVHEEFAPSPEADCQWCAMKPLCPLWPEGREMGVSK